MRIRSVVILVLLILFLIVTAQNTDAVKLRILFWDLQTSRIILLVFTLVLGIVVGVLLGRPWKRRRRERATATEPTDTVSESERSSP